MRHLVDAHSLIWALDDPRKLEPRAIAVLEDSANELLVSVGTIWELSIKVGLGKLSLSLPYRTWMEKALVDLALVIDTGSIHGGRSLPASLRRFSGRRFV